ncbi:MAG: hypothetical protein HN783_10185, partial [Ilumatobacter sp.]|nr:hypothetical protein [Ilumatobacter sp.]
MALGEHDAKDRAVGRPPAPEDRTWRHPAEVAWEARQAPRPVVAVAAEIIADGTTTHIGIGVTTRDPEDGGFGSAVTAMVQDG